MRRRSGLTGFEVYDVSGIAGGLEPGGKVSVRATRRDGSAVDFKARVRLDSEVEVDYYRNGGILHTVLRKLAAQ